MTDGSAAAGPSYLSCYFVLRGIFAEKGRPQKYQVTQASVLFSEEAEASTVAETVPDVCESSE